MKVLKNYEVDLYDFMIIGLGYESRSIAAYLSHHQSCGSVMAIGYKENTDVLHYKENKEVLIAGGVSVYEKHDIELCDLLASFDIYEKEIKIMLDVTVFSRHRLALILDYLICNLCEKSIVTIVYNASTYVPPPDDTTPIKTVAEIAPQFSGMIGDLSKPTSLILGLGYEKGKALGVANYFEAGRDFLFLPMSNEERFEEFVRANNGELLNLVPDEDVFCYEVEQPYATYLSLRSLVLETLDCSRILLVPLGPKILAAISVIIARELHPKLPVWRVSSNHTEKPVERAQAGGPIYLSLKV